MHPFLPRHGAEAPDPSQPPPLAAPFLVLVESLAGMLARGEPSDTLPAELEAFDHDLGALQAGFRHEMAHQDLAPDEEMGAAEVLEEFQNVAEHLTPLREAAEQGDVATMSAETPPLVTHLRALSAAFERLRAADAARPLLSPIPAVNGLLRVAAAVGEERLAFDVLAARAQAVLSLLDGIGLSLREAGGAESALTPLLEAHREAVEALHACATREDATTLVAAAAIVRETAQALFEAQQQLPPAHPIETRSLPEAPPVETLPAYAGELVLLADRLLEGEACLEAFQTTVQTLRQRTRQALALLEKLPVLTPDVPEEERAACEEGQVTAENGLEMMLEALEHFDNVCKTGDGWSLEPGIERLRAAITELRHVSSAFDTLRR